MLAKRFNALYGEGDFAEIRRLLHPDVVVASRIADTVLAGPDDVLAAAKAASESSFAIAIDRVEDLSETVALGEGSVRYRRPGTNVIATSHVAWLWRFEDGRLIRAVTYHDVAEAEAAFDAEADDFPVTAPE
jgi:ketosteroid isomerase-like protein